MGLNSFADKSEHRRDIFAQDVAMIQKLFKDKLGVFCYPAFGTLLGVVRGGDFIADDTDIDMCWHSNGDTRENVLKNVLVMYHRAHKLGVFGFPHNRIGTMKVKLDAVNRPGGLTYVDMCVSWEEGGNYWVNIFGSYGQHIDMTPIPAKLRGVDVLIPRDAEKILEFTYGDWKTPRKHDDPNVRAKHIIWGSYLI